MMTDDLPTTPDPLPAELPPDAPAAVPPDSAPSEPVAAEHVETASEPAPAASPPDNGAVGEAAPNAPPESPAPAPSKKHWYVVKVQSGREESIKEAIERRVKIDALEEYFGQIYIPTEKVTEMRNGKRYSRERKVLPGYIMAEVEYNDRILYLFRETSGVGDFVGGGINREPPPMQPQEVARWLGIKEQGTEEGGKIKHDFEISDRLRVKDGMFAGMEGEVKEILEAKNSIKIELTIFGRPVAVELEYWQVEHV